jgi:hypothetical protein
MSSRTTEKEMVWEAECKRVGMRTIARAGLGIFSYYCHSVIRRSNICLCKIFLKKYSLYLTISLEWSFCFSSYAKKIEFFLTSK